MIRWWVALLTMGVALGVGWAGYAAPQVEVSTGIAQRVVENTLTPVYIHIEHQGLPIDGELVLSQTVESPWRGVFTETLTQPLTLGQRANKALTVYFPLHTSVYPLQLQILDQHGEVVVEQTLDLRDLTHTGPLVVALSETGFPHELPTGERVFLLRAEEVPDRPEALEAVQRLYLGRFNLGALDPAQQQALLHWVMLGGELVVLSGDHWYVQDHPLLRTWLPIDRPRVEAVDYGGSPLPTLVGEPLTTATVAAGAGDTPWVVRRQVGQGTLWLVTVDPWAVADSDRIWSVLEHKRPFQNEVAFSEKATDTFLQQKLRFPTRILIAGLLGVFIGGAGLLTWLAMRKPWATLALLGWVGAVCVGLFLVVNQPQYAQSLTTAEYGVETTLPDGAAFHQTWFGVYAQRGERAVVRFPAGATVRQQVPLERGLHLYDVVYELDEATAVRFASQPQQIRSFVSLTGHPPTVRWALDPGAGEIELLSHTDLERAWVMYRGILYDLGAVPKGTMQRRTLNRLPTLNLDAQLPEEVAGLWSWALDNTQSRVVLGAWHRDPVADPSGPTAKQTFQLVVSEVAL